MILAISTSFVELIFMGTYLRFIKKKIFGIGSGQVFTSPVQFGLNYYACGLKRSKNPARHCENIQQTAKMQAQYG